MTDVNNINNENEENEKNAVSTFQRQIYPRVIVDEVLSPKVVFSSHSPLSDNNSLSCKSIGEFVTEEFNARAEFLCDMIKSHETLPQIHDVLFVNDQLRIRFDSRVFAYVDPLREKANIAQDAERTDTDKNYVELNFLEFFELLDSEGNVLELENDCFSLSTSAPPSSSTPSSSSESSLSPPVVAWPTGMNNQGRVDVTPDVNAASWEYSLDSGQSWNIGLNNSFLLPRGTYTLNSIQIRNTDSMDNEAVVTNSGVQDQVGDLIVVPKVSQAMTEEFGETIWWFNLSITSENSLSSLRILENAIINIHGNSNVESEHSVVLSLRRRLHH